MIPFAATAMAARLTAPFGRGADSLRLQLPATTKAGVAEVEAYDFAQHQALYGLDPAPRYIVAPLVDQDADVALTIEYEVSPGGDLQKAEVTIPAGTIAGTS